jgi:hypothetical protein
MTAVGLEELPGLIGKGTRVVLAVGHCPLCLRHKAPILRTILAQKQPYVTHVVVDSFTAREVVRGPAALPSGPAQPLLSA